MQASESAIAHRLLALGLAAQVAEVVDRLGATAGGTVEARARSPGVEALTRSWINHMYQNYMRRPECHAAANAPLIGGQAGNGTATLWGGGLVAAVDGTRFVVPVRTIDARPNPKYLEDQLGALGLVVNCVTLWNTVYLDRILATLRESGYPVLDEDVLRIHPYWYAYINVHGHYSFQPLQLADGIGRRPLRDSGNTDPDEE